MQEEFKDTRLNFVDEVSFADYNTVLSRLSYVLQRFTNVYQSTYGNAAMCFLGDFRQLEPVGNNAAYNHEEGVFWEQSLTHMVELQGTHRFNECEVLREIMPELRNQGLSEEARAKLNERVVKLSDIPAEKVKDLRFATYFNQKRAEINRAMFLSYLKNYHSKDENEGVPRTAIVIKSNGSWSGGKRLSFNHRKVLFEECLDSHCQESSGNKRADPFLCLWSGCHVMGTDNTDVTHGIANGITSIFEKCIFKSGKRPHKIKVDGFWVYAINIKDVQSLVLRWSDCRFEGTYKIQSKNRTFKVNYPIVEEGKSIRVAASMKLEHFSILLNHATTGHKLQGKSMENLVISQWSKVKNWAYVVLSRVRKITGLYLLSEIPRDIDFSPDPKYLRMMDRLRQRILKTPDDVTDLMAEVINIE